MRRTCPAVLCFVLCVILAAMVIPSPACAEEAAALRPHWSLEIKGGRFVPDIGNWRDYYGSRSTGMLAGALAYKVLRQVEVGIEGGYARDKGQGYAPLHGTFAGSVQYEIAPLHVFALFRGVFTEDQWLVPYAGGGWSRYFYRVKIENQATLRGSADGYHGRAGLQLLLDALDPKAANNMFLEFGVQHTYLFIEAQTSRAMADTIATATEPSSEVNLGGTCYLIGLLFEF